DLIRRNGRTAWVARAFAGTRWQEPRGEAPIAYQVNTYRVLLTRARYDTVIWVPSGDAADATRDPATFDGIAAFLLACGARPLDTPPIMPEPTLAQPALLL
ncbi:MAG TPA: DNA/RNA helicase domain-containing protein, partial [Acetobacteraceae bacterium]